MGQHIVRRPTIDHPWFFDYIQIGVCPETRKLGGSVPCRVGTPGFVVVPIECKGQRNVELTVIYGDFRSLAFFSGALTTTLGFHRGNLLFDAGRLARAAA